MVSLLAGITTLTLLMGFPAVAIQFHRLGVPLDLAPQRSFIIAGVMPTAIFAAAVLSARRRTLPKISTDSGHWRFLKDMGRGALPYLLGGVMASAAALISGIAQAELLGQGIRHILAGRFDIHVWVGRTIAAMLILPAFFFGMRAESAVVRILAGSSALAGSALVLYFGAGPAFAFLVAAFVLPALFAPFALVALWLFNRKVARGNAFGDHSVLIFLASTVGPFVLAAVPTGIAMSEIARAGLVVLRIIPSSARHESWLIGGLVAGLFVSHGSIVMACGVAATNAMPFVKAAIWPRIVAAAHVALAVALLMIHAFGVYSYAPRAFLGGRPACMAGRTKVVLPKAWTHGGSRPLAANAGSEFERLCALVFTSGEAVLCSNDVAPASCLVIQRNDIPVVWPR